MPAPSLNLQPVTALSSHTGFPLRHPYVEHVYAPVVGPTSVLVLRRAALLFDAFPDGLRVDPVEFASSLGVGHRGGDNSPLNRTLSRLDRFSLASWNPEVGTLEVPTQVRPVPDRWLSRLPESTLAVHRSLMASLEIETPTVSVPRIPAGPAVSLGIGR